VSREARLASRPDGIPTLHNFSFADVSLDALEPGAVSVRNLWMSVDPYMRGRMRAYETYLPPFQVDRVLEGAAVGEVIESSAAAFQPGDLVFSMKGWRQIFDAPSSQLRKLSSQVPQPEMHLSVLGNSGLTAYIGINEVLRIKNGETLFVSAAAGAVGSLVCQMARLKGATVIASVGGAEKESYIRTLGIDKVIDYKSTQDLPGALRELAPTGIDAYFDNVGGLHLDAALACARNFARFALCGMIAGYNGASAAPHNMLMAIEKRIMLQGFLVSDHIDKRDHFVSAMMGWLDAGQIVYRQTVEYGIENAPAAFIKLFDGQNIGKMLVKL
jgi:NADPH-dependent curcumin reductase CurA